MTQVYPIDTSYSQMVFCHWIRLISVSALFNCVKKRTRAYTQYANRFRILIRAFSIISFRIDSCIKQSNNIQLLDQFFALIFCNRIHRKLRLQMKNAFQNECFFMVDLHVNYKTNIWIVYVQYLTEFQLTFHKESNNSIWWLKKHGRKNGNIENT